jgi:hypothetical protein
MVHAQNQAIRKHPMHFWNLLMSGLIAWGQGNHKAALGVLSQCLSLKNYERDVVDAEGNHAGTKTVSEGSRE